MQQSSDKKYTFKKIFLFTAMLFLLCVSYSGETFAQYVVLNATDVPTDVSTGESFNSGGIIYRRAADGTGIPIRAGGKEIRVDNDGAYLLVDGTNSNSGDGRQGAMEEGMKNFFDEYGSMFGPGAMDKIMKGAFHKVLGSMLGGADQVYANVGFSCWSCELLTIAFFFNEVLGVKAFLLVQDSAKNLLKAMLSLWLVLEVAKILLPFGPMGQAQGIFNDIFVKLGWGVIAFALISSGEDGGAHIRSEGSVYDNKAPSTFGELTFTYYTVAPVMRAALLWGNAILEESETLFSKLQGGIKNFGVINKTANSKNKIDWKNAKGGGNSTEETYHVFTYRSDASIKALRTTGNITSDADTGGTETISDEIWCRAPVTDIESSMDLSTTLYSGLLCRIARIQQELGLPLVLAIFNIFQPGERQAIWENALYGVFNGMFLSTLSQLIAGIMLFGIYGLAIFTYPFNVMEGIFRITIGTIVAPVAIALGVFKPFRGPLKMVFTMIIHGAVSILFVSIAVAIGMNLVRVSLSMITGMYNQTLEKAVTLINKKKNIGLDENLILKYKITNLRQFLLAVDGTLLKSNLFTKYADGVASGNTPVSQALNENATMESHSETADGKEADRIEKSKADQQKFKMTKELEGVIGTRGHLMLRVEVHSSPFWILFFASALLNYLIRAADKMAGQLTENQFGSGAASGVAGLGQGFFQGATMSSMNAGRQWNNMSHQAFGNVM